MSITAHFLFVKILRYYDVWSLHVEIDFLHADSVVNEVKLTKNIREFTLKFK